MFILQVFAFFFPINLSDPFCHNENVIKRNTFTLSSTFNSFGSKANEKENENENVVYARLLCGCVCVCVPRASRRSQRTLSGLLAFDARNALFEFHGDFMSFVIRFVSKHTSTHTPSHTHMTWLTCTLIFLLATCTPMCEGRGRRGILTSALLVNANEALWPMKY